MKNGTTFNSLEMEPALEDKAYMAETAQSVCKTEQ